jgi:4-amino-4-deoxy-L-arabinose transferase-like glycosyltransferase
MPARRLSFAPLTLGALLFAATAAFVLWQDAHLTVLWDLSYILENSWRMACGQLPYRDFPFPYAPLTFTTQAAIVWLFGRAVWHHYVYAALAAGAATLLTWRIARQLLQDARLPRGTVAFLLAAPLVFLGTGSVFPHPFYDADCTLSVLFCLWLMLRAEQMGFPHALSFAAGAALVLPALCKQNTGLAFLLAALFCVGFLALWRLRAAWMLAGAATGIAVTLAAIQLSVGLGSYLHWTLGFAAARRLPGLPLILSIYADRALLPGYAAVAAGALLYRAHRGRRSRRWLAAALLSVPAAIALSGLLRFEDPADRVESLLHIWPPLLAASAMVALWQLPRARSLRTLAPLMLLGAVHGAFLSQQLWGSTYALWPLLMLLIAALLVALAPRIIEGREAPRHTLALSAATLFTSLALLVAGGYYALSHERLDYVDMSGEMMRSRLPALRGLAMRGEWLPEFEQLAAYAQANTPAGDVILSIPGEDLFYYATGRVPGFPVLMMDHTINPYTAAELAQLAAVRHVRWVIVKRRLQLQEEPIPFRDELLQRLAPEFEPAASLDNYDLYRRRR